MNHELASLYKADKQERVNQPPGNTVEYKAMRARDQARRERVLDMVAANELNTAEDYYQAAHIMNHGDTVDDARHAHRFAFRSSELGYRPARWLAVASYDRWQMYQGQPQNMGRIMYMTDEKTACGTWTQQRQMRKEPAGMSRPWQSSSVRHRR
jgi:hypothetical protein